MVKQKNTKARYKKALFLIATVAYIAMTVGFVIMADSLFSGWAVMSVVTALTAFYFAFKNIE